MAGGSKTASIKLTLDKGGFSGGLKATEAEAKGVAQRMGAAFKSAMGDGAKGAKDAVSGMLSSIKGTITSLGGLAGGIGAIDLARDAVLGAQAFRRLADQVRRGSGEVVDFRRLQDDARESANRWSQDANDLGKAMKGMFDETGDITFARVAIDQVATAARAGVGSVEQLGNIAGTLNEKFDVAGEDIGEALAVVAEMTSKGGISVEDMAARLGLMGAAAKEAGLTGEDGFRRMVALMNIADDSTGNLRKGMTGVAGILEQLGEKKSSTKIAQTLGIDAKSFSGASVEGKIEQILKKTRGNKSKLEAVFGGEQLKIVSDLGKQYAAAYDATTGDAKAKATAGAEAVRKAFSDAAKTTTTFSDLQADAARELESTEAKMQTALNKLRDIFVRDDIQAAIGRLAESLPKLADAVAGLASWAVDNPIKAGGAAVGAVALNGFAQATVSSLISSAFSKGGADAAGKIASSLATGGTNVATSLASSFGAGGPIALGIAAAIAIGFAAKALSDLDEENRAAHAAEQDRQNAQIEGEGETYDAKTGKYIRKTKDLYGGESNEAFDVSLGRKGLGGLLGRTQQMADDAEVDAELNAQSDAYYARKPSGGGGGGFSKADQMLLAEMLAAKKLRVEVVNLEQLRAGGAGGGPTTPTPGNVPRR